MCVCVCVPCVCLFVCLLVCLCVSIVGCVCVYMCINTRYNSSYIACLSARACQRQIETATRVTRQGGCSQSTQREIARFSAEKNHRSRKRLLIKGRLFKIQVADNSSKVGETRRLSTQGQDERVGCSRGLFCKCFRMEKGIETLGRCCFWAERWQYC